MKEDEPFRPKPGLEEMSETDLRFWVMETTFSIILLILALGNLKSCLEFRPT